MSFQNSVSNKEMIQMRKSTLIFSIALTGVVLALLFMLVSSYRKIVANNAARDGLQQTQASTQELAQSEQPAQLTPSLTEAPLAVGTLQIYDAAPIAAKVVGHDDVYITEYAQLNGADAYLVTFLSGDLVYVSLDGKVISASKQSPFKLSQPTSHR
jgi:hypothetical protein